MERIKGGLENLLSDGKQLIIELFRLEKIFKIIEPNHDKDFFSFFFPKCLINYSDYWLRLVHTLVR